MSTANETSFNNSSSTLLCFDEGTTNPITTPPTTSSIVHRPTSKSKTTRRGSGSGGHESSSVYDTPNNSRRVPALIPPQRLAIPQKYLNSNGSCGIGKSGLVLEVDAAPASIVPSKCTSTNENKPLVQWDSDESEEELSFFPKPKKKLALSDNLSVENMNISGDDDDDDDLHLTPPKPKSVLSGCPCDPRLLVDSKWFKPNHGSASMSKSTSSTFRRRLDNRACTIA